jgi:hypothetical protein
LQQHHSEHSLLFVAPLLLCQFNAKAFLVDLHFIHYDLKQLLHLNIGKVFKLILDLVVTTFQKCALVVYQKSDTSFENKHLAVEQETIDYSTGYFEIEDFYKTSEHPISQIEGRFYL